MVLNAKPRMTANEVLELRMAHNPALLALDVGDDTTMHFKELTKASVKHHDRLKKYWRNFVVWSGLGLDEEIKVGSREPGLAVLKKFAHYLVATCQGTVGKPVELADGTTLPPNISRTTLARYMTTFCAMWRRYANIIIPLPIRNQNLAFVDSPELKAAAPLPTNMRKKNYADNRDLILLISEFWSSIRFRTSRMKLQMAYACLLMALTSERPGAVVESSQYKNSNEAILWKDHEFWILPNPDDANRPHLAIIVTINLLKGKTKDDAIFKQFFLMPQSDGTRSSDPYMMVLCLAIQDEIFVEVNTPQEILFPERPITKPVALTIRDEMQGIPVLRKEEKGPAGFSISSSKALPYDSWSRYLRQCSLDAGLQDWVKGYDFRRGASNRFSEELTPEKRKQLMGHATASAAFWTSYQSRLASTTDLQGLLGEGQSAEKVAIFSTITNISRNADKNAPGQLTIKQRADILNEPELLLEEASQLKDALTGDQSTDVALTSKISDLHAEAAKLIRQHGLLFNREAAVRLGQARANFFRNAANQVLNGVTVNQTVVGMSAASSAIVNPDDLDSQDLPGGHFHDKFADKMVNPLGDFLHLTSSCVGRGPNEHLLECTNALLSLPRNPRSKFYANESATSANLCPVCALDLSTMAQRQGEHVHKCLHQARLRAINDDLASSFEPTHCNRSNCKRKDDIFADRSDFVNHMNKHVQMLLSADSKRSCDWIDVPGGTPCSVAKSADWDLHFARDHGINIGARGNLDYCFVSNRWFPDLIGDRLEWTENAENLFVRLFEPFADRNMPRPEQPLASNPIGMKFGPADQGYVEYERGSSFDGALPEYHGYFDDNLVLVPAFCPFCVYQKDMEIFDRMKQWSEPFLLGRHIRDVHLGDFTSKTVVHCPSPSCGGATYNNFTLRHHLVTFHRLPICGGTNQSKVVRLILPLESDFPVTDLLADANLDVASGPELEGRIAQPFAKNKTRRIVVSSASEGDNQVPPTKRQKTEPQPKAKVKRKSLPHYCFGCQRMAEDILSHIDDGKCNYKGDYYAVRTEGVNRRQWPKCSLAELREERKPSQKNASAGSSTST